MTDFCSAITTATKYYIVYVIVIILAFAALLIVNVGLNNPRSPSDYIGETPYDILVFPLIAAFWLIPPMAIASALCSTSS